MLALVSLGWQALFGQNQPTTNLEVEHDVWTFMDGAPGSITGMAETSDGFLWFSAPTGLYRFDGTRFELFHSQFGDKLLSTNIYSVFAPPSGGLWVGYAFGGFSFVKNGRVTNYGGKAESSTGSVYHFAENQNGDLWAITGSGLWRFDHSSWQHIGAEWNAPPDSRGEMGFDRRGILWFLASNGPQDSPAGGQLFYLLPGATKFRWAERIRDGVGLREDANEEIVTSPASAPTVRNSGGHTDQPPAYPVLTNGAVQLVDQTGSIWVEPEKAVLIRRPPPGPPGRGLEKDSARNSQTYAFNPVFTARLVDREGDVWIGDEKDVHRFFYSPLIRQEFPGNPEGAAFFTVVPDEHGVVWVVADYDVKASTLYRVSNGSTKVQGSFHGLTAFAYPARDRTFWFGGEGGLWHLTGGKLDQVRLPPVMRKLGSHLQAITEDRLGGMWVSFGRNGFYRLANGVWTPNGGHEDLPKIGVLVEFTDSLGRVWFGYTQNRVAMLDGDRVQVYGPGEGLRLGNVTAICGRGSEIWVGGELGLEEFDHGRFHSINAENEDWLRGITGIAETANGDLWINGLGGIVHLRRSEISESLQNPAHQAKGEHFGRRDGLPGLPPQVRPLKSLVEGTDGRLWFAEDNGLVWLDPSRAEGEASAPPVTIESVSAGDRFYAPVSPQKFPARTSSVQITFAAVSLAHPDAIHFRYKLDETDKSWHETAVANPVGYHNLGPGTYHFSVQATDTNGVWADRVATLQFTIQPAFYQTGWFLALWVAAALTLLYLLYLLRLRQVARQFHMRLDERVAERTRIARELHDTLLQSFQGVLLRFQSASNLLPKRPGEAKQTLDSAIDQGAQAITEGRNAVQGLRSSTVEKSDLAAALTSLGAELTGRDGYVNSTEFHVVVEGAARPLRSDLRDEIFRIGAEAVRNAFDHAQAKRIEVEIRYDEREFRLRVRDDGVGIDPQPLSEGAGSGHYGLRGMRERATLLGGKLAVWSERDAGTEVEVGIPASRAYETSPLLRLSWLAKKLFGGEPEASG